MRIKFLSLSFCFLIINMNHLIGQNLEKLKQERDSIYQSNIKKSRLYGVYIPVDLQDAIGELKRLSDEESLRKYKNAPEDFVVKKLLMNLQNIR